MREKNYLKGCFLHCLVKLVLSIKGQLSESGILWNELSLMLLFILGGRRDPEYFKRHRDEKETAAGGAETSPGSPARLRGGCHRNSGLHSRLTPGVRPHLEGKQRTPLSS